MVGRDSFFGVDNNDFYREEPDSNQDQYRSDSPSFTPTKTVPIFPFPELSGLQHTQSMKALPPDPHKLLSLKTRGPSAHYRRERERALSNTSVDSLIQRLISEEYQAKETKKLLRTALSHLEVSTQRVTSLEAQLKAMETSHVLQGLKVTQGVLDAQQETAKAQQEVGLYKLQLQHAEREVQRAQTVVRAVEDERDEAERSATKARTQARQLKEEKLIMFAREEGRKEGYEEGVRQGRLLAYSEDGDAPRRKPIADHMYATPLGSGAAFIEEYDEGEDDGESTEMDENGHLPPPAHHFPDMTRSMQAKQYRRTSRQTPRQTPHHRHASLDSTPRGRPDVPRSMPSEPIGPQTASRPPSTAPVSQSTVQDDAMRHELEAARREAAEALRREAEQREEIRKWKERDAEHKLEAERQAAIARDRAREAELERERESVRRRDAEREREMEIIRQKDREREAEREKERQALQKEKEAWEKERAREKELMAQSKNVSTRPAGPTAPLPYLPMPAPPIQALAQPASASVVPPFPTQAQNQPQTQPQPQAQPQTQFQRVQPQQVQPQQVQPQQVQPQPRQPQQPQQQVQPQPFHPSHRRRPSSPDTRSPSSTTTGISAFDIITFPTSGTSRRGEDRDREREARDLSDIPENPSVRSQSRTSEAPQSPTWLTDPPTDYRSQAFRGSVDDWRRNSGAYHPNGPGQSSPLTPSELLSPSFQPRGRGTDRQPSNLQRRGSSGSTNSYNIVVQPPSRPSSLLEERVERDGFLSPSHAPTPLAPEPTQPVIPTYSSSAEVFNRPPPGFVPQFTSPPGQGKGHTPGSSIYGGRAGPSQPVYQSFSAAQGAPTHGQGPPSPGGIYGDQQPWPYGNNSRNTGSVTPRQIYSPTPPAFSHSALRGAEGPVIPGTPRASQRTPHGGIYGATTPTPGAYQNPLPGAFSVTPRGGILKKTSSNGSLSSSHSYSRFNSNYSEPPYDHDDSGDSSPDAATRRNTMANAASAAGALPIPPPSFSRWRG